MKIFLNKKLSHQGLAMSKIFLLSCPQIPGFTCSQSNVYVLACNTSGQSSIVIMEENWSLPKKQLLIAVLKVYYFQSIYSGWTLITTLTPYIKVGLSPSKKICVVCWLDWKLIKNDKKCFLFHPKSSFCSKDI